MEHQHHDRNKFWSVRAEHYDKLYWARDKSYVEAIIEVGDFLPTDLVLDVGTGTGMIAKAIAPHTKHVVGLDVSSGMLEKGQWEGVSIIKWDISESIFVNNIFDKLVARMVFHHLLDFIDRAFLRCYDLLRSGGMLIVAEGVPPVDDEDVIAWYTEMFRHKEERRTFIPSQLVDLFEKTGFRNIKVYTHIMEDFSIKNWIENSGLEKENQDIILDLHINAPQKIKEVYNMRITKDDCIVRTKNVIVTGQKMNSF